MLDDDLNTPAAIAELFQLARMAQHESSPIIRGRLKVALLQAGGLLGLLQQAPQDWLAWAATAGRNDPDAELIEQREIETLIAERDEARAAKDFARADRLRDQLISVGIAVEDRADRTLWRRVSS